MTPATQDILQKKINPWSNQYDSCTALPELWQHHRSIGGGRIRDCSKNCDKALLSLEMAGLRSHRRNIKNEISTSNRWDLTLRPVTDWQEGGFQPEESDRERVLIPVKK